MAETPNSISESSPEDEITASAAGRAEAAEQAADEAVAVSAARAVKAPPGDGALSEAAIQPFAAPEFSEAVPAAEPAGIHLLDDVELNVKIELGRTQMYIEDVLKLNVGAVIVLDKLAGDPVDIYVNERLVARGEVLVLNDNFCVRINDILSPIPELEGAK